MSHTVVVTRDESEHASAEKYRTEMPGDGLMISLPDVIRPVVIMVHYYQYLVNMIPRLSCTALHVRQAYPILQGIAYIVCMTRCASFCVAAGFEDVSV